MKKKGLTKDIIKRDVLPWFFLVPAIISFVMFKYYPILLGFFVSFFNFVVYANGITRVE